MTDGEIKDLAAFFTGPDVVKNSIALNIPGAPSEQAKRFFAARSALGIDGYSFEEEACQAISAKLLMHQPVPAKAPKPKIKAPAVKRKP